jgi:hypothetical protein
MACPPADGHTTMLPQASCHHAPELRPPQIMHLMDSRDVLHVGKGDGQRHFPRAIATLLAYLVLMCTGGISTGSPWRRKIRSC